MHNVGSVFRTSDGFRIEKLILCGITAQPPHRDINKAALGAQDMLEWEHFEKTGEAVEHLKRTGYKVLAIEQAEGSKSLSDFSPDPSGKYAFVFGNEVFGVEDSVMDIVDDCLEIPQYGAKHSFNISVSVGIILWDFFSKMKPFTSR
jgi:tRNA G18 (ribose-2'-O)-methylase SpoU